MLETSRKVEGTEERMEVAYCTSWGTYIHRTRDGERTLCGARAGGVVEPTASDVICESCETAYVNVVRYVEETEE